jgi:hypothetical protein
MAKRAFHFEFDKHVCEKFDLFLIHFFPIFPIKQ